MSKCSQMYEKAGRWSPCIAGSHHRRLPTGQITPQRNKPASWTKHQLSDACKGLGHTFPLTPQRASHRDSCSQLVLSLSQSPGRCLMLPPRLPHSLAGVGQAWWQDPALPSPGEHPNPHSALTQLPNTWERCCQMKEQPLTYHKAKQV